MEDFRKKTKYYPVLLYYEQNCAGDNDFTVFRQRIDALPQKTQDILTSDVLVRFIYDIERHRRKNFRTWYESIFFVM
ncbi:MAG: hypothetical protein CR972_05360 [Candidatus Moraniibacteriota bacterium]|nr:MAG: hypothetical protein CR972_05360 [Candidatus Moranbacteria bacterium]